MRVKEAVANDCLPVFIHLSYGTPSSLLLARGFFYPRMTNA